MDNDFQKAIGIVNFLQNVSPAKMPMPEVIPYAVDVLDPDKPGGYKKMLKTGEIIDFDDYASAASGVYNQDEEGTEASDIMLKSLTRRKEFAQENNLPNIPPVGGVGGNDYNSMGTTTPEVIQEEVHSRNMDMLNQRLQGSNQQNNNFWNALNE